MSFGASTSSYASRPATLAEPVVVTDVVGSIAARALAAASCGVTGRSEGVVACGVAAPAGSLRCWAVLSRLVHIHTSVPLRMTSVSPSVPSSASRTLVSPAYQTRAVLLPVISLVMSEPLLPPSADTSGSPRSALSTTVPDSPSTLAVCTSTRSCAALRAGRAGSALATIVPAAAPPPITATAAAVGTSQRSAGLDLSMLTMSTSRCHAPILQRGACDRAEKNP